MKLLASPRHSVAQPFAAAGGEKTVDRLDRPAADLNPRSQERGKPSRKPYRRVL
jgi:hypothetical protein